ncbi:uncharacterized protein LOC141848290 [Curcuma longa]|uniref:uncharacterized protein LOC141848290 n=1 Tax=Curcuma longa TaxID=136217 RepID=UPI003D9DB61A
MAFRLRSYFTILLLIILLFETSSCMIQSSESGTQHPYLMTKHVRMRRALQEFIQDYENGGPNPKHDPKKGKPGGKGP